MSSRGSSERLVLAASAFLVAFVPAVSAVAGGGGGGGGQRVASVDWMPALLVAAMMLMTAAAALLPQRPRTAPCRKHQDR